MGQHRCASARAAFVHLTEILPASTRNRFLDTPQQLNVCGKGIAPSFPALQANVQQKIKLQLTYISLYVCHADSIQLRLPCWDVVALLTWTIMCHSAKKNIFILLHYNIIDMGISQNLATRSHGTDRSGNCSFGSPSPPGEKIKREPRWRCTQDPDR